MKDEKKTTSAAEMSSSRNQISINELAERSTYSVRHLRDLSKSGVIPKAKRGTYDRIDALQQILAYILEQRITEAQKKEYLIAKTKQANARTRAIEAETNSSDPKFIPAEKLKTSFAQLPRISIRLHKKQERRFLRFVQDALGWESKDKISKTLEDTHDDYHQNFGRAILKAVADALGETLPEQPEESKL